MTKTPSTYINLKQAAELTGLSVKTIRRRISDGTLPGYRAGRLLRVKINDLDALFLAVPSSSAR